MAIDFDGTYVLLDDGPNPDPYACCNGNRIGLPEAFEGVHLDTSVDVGADDPDIPGDNINILQVGGGEKLMRPWVAGFPTNKALSSYPAVLEVRLGQSVRDSTPVSLTSSKVNGQTYAVLALAPTSKVDMANLKKAKNL